MSDDTPEPVPAPVSIYTAEQAAQRLHTSAATIRRWIRRGILRASRPGGGGYLVTEDAIRQMLVASEVRA